MALRLLSDRKLIEIQEFHFCCDSKKDKNMGYWFPCTKDGRLFLDEHFGDASISSLHYVFIEHPEQFHASRVMNTSRSYWQDALYECKCGNVLCMDGDVECDCCGRTFNAFGQEINANYSREDAAMDGIAWDEEDY